MRWLKLDPEIARKSFERSLVVVSRDGTADPDAVENQPERAGKRVGRPNVTVSQVVDYRLLRRVQKEIGIGK